MIPACGRHRHVFASAVEARSVISFLRERGIVSIDVGCFQVNLRHHPAALAGVAEGFDPDANADYAARFLRRLFEFRGSWEAAIGDYHSAEPGLGQDYRAKVLRAWHGLHAKARASAPPAAAKRGDPHLILWPRAPRRFAGPKFACVPRRCP